MISNKNKVYIVFILLAIFAVPSAYSFVNIDQYDYICKIDKNQNNQNNEKYNSHCDQCYFYFDETDLNVTQLVELVTDIISINNYRDLSSVLKPHHRITNTRAPPIV